MTYRNDKDALVARADALTSENARLKEGFNSAVDERDELRAKFETNDRELKRLQKALAKYEKPKGNGPTVAVFAALGVAAVLAAAGFTVFMTSEGQESQAVLAKQAAHESAMAEKEMRDLGEVQDEPNALSAQEAEAAGLKRAKAYALISVRWCLDTTDFAIRTILLNKDAKTAPSELPLGRKRDTTCSQQLAEINDDTLPELAPAIKIYREALEEILPTIDELVRYHNEEDFEDDQYAGAIKLLAALQRKGAPYITTSNALRKLYMPVFRGFDKDAHANLLGAASTDFMDAIFATSVSFQQVDDAMTRINSSRGVSDEPTHFYKYAKRIHRALRAQGSAPKLTVDHLSDLDLLVLTYSLNIADDTADERRVRWAPTEGW